MRRSAVGSLVLLAVAAGIVAATLVGRRVITLVRGRSAPVPVRRVGERMPPFELVDLTGRTWRRSDLEGRTAFVDVWATWCQPCRKELPHVQRLYDRLKGRPDVVLLTMNVDEKPSEVQPFVAANGYTFPVLLAHDYVRTTLATIGIPRNWVIDAAGVWRFDEIGYDEHTVDWVGDAERMIDRTLSESGPAEPAVNSPGR
jgi:thiol-disulfide isomerase/thioredoxin